MKLFPEAVKDGFTHVTTISDPETVKKMRSEGILVDDEGYYFFDFGDNKEYELRIEPILDAGKYQVALYKNGVLLTEKVPFIALLTI